MIEINLDKRDFFVSQLNKLTINLMNTSQELLTNIVFGLKLPPSVRLQKGLKQVEIQKLAPNETFKHTIQIVPVSKGTPVLTVFNFSYRNSLGKVKLLEDTTYPIIVKQAPISPKPETKAKSNPTTIQNTETSEKVSDPSNKQQKILILSAIPHGLRVDKEIRQIEEAIKRAMKRDLFEICIKTAVRPQDIRRAIAEEEPQIVHFCGHGLSNGDLVLEDDGGDNKPVSPEALGSLFKLHCDYVKCVLLNACYSEKPAIEISKYIDYAIGMNQPIEDKAAIVFAQGFYDALGYKTSTNKDVFQRAFDEGLVAIQMENISQELIPVLKRCSQKN
jgi:hypothetical protein